MSESAIMRQTKLLDSGKTNAVTGLVCSLLLLRAIAAIQTEELSSDRAAMRVEREASLRPMLLRKETGLLRQNLSSRSN